MDKVVERMGLRVVKNTLEPDWDSQHELKGILGSIEIEVTDRCLLRDELIEEIAPLLARDVCDDHFDGRLQIEFWDLRRKGRLLVLTPNDSSSAFDRCRSHSNPYFNQHAADVRPSQGW